MSKPIHICFPTLNRYDLLAESISSLIKGTLRPTTINVVDNGGKFIENFGNISKIDEIPLKVYVPGINIGVGRAWNYFFNTLEDNIVICNDDTIAKEKTLELLMKASEENPNEVFFTPEVYWEHAFSFYHLRKKAWTEIGEFDNNFFAYFEDRCALYRMKLKGYKPFTVKGCIYTHVDGGSNTIKTSEEKESISRRFAEFSQYYNIKYGGLPGNETYTKLFNLLS